MNLGFNVVVFRIVLVGFYLILVCILNDFVMATLNKDDHEKFIEDKKRKIKEKLAAAQNKLASTANVSTNSRTSTLWVHSNRKDTSYKK